MKTLSLQFADRRTLEQFRASDSVIEKRWRARVRMNPKEIVRLAKRDKPVVAVNLELRATELPMLLRRQAG